MTNSKTTNTVLTSALNNEHLSKTLKDAIRKMLKENKEIKKENEELKNPAIKKEKTNEECFAWWNGLSEEWKDVFRQRVTIGQDIELKDIKSIFELKYLDCSATDIENLEPVKSLIKLRYLDCTYTGIEDLSPLANMNNLQELDFSGTKIKDLEPIKDLVKLEGFWCSATYVTDLSPLANLPKLKQLYYPKGIDTSCIKNLIESGLDAEAM